MDPRYATALATAAASQANLGDSPNGNSGDIQHLQNLGQIQFKAGASQAGMGAFTGALGNDVDKQDAATRAAAQAQDNQAKIAEITRAAKEKYDQAMADPSNYIREVSDDGGYNFYTPDRRPISVQQYSKVTGKQIPKALEGSQNPNDTQFSKDYNQLLEYGRALAGDQSAVDKFKEKNADWLAANKNKTYADVVGQFREHYSQYMQPNQTNNMPDKNAAGQPIVNDTASPTGVNWLEQFLGLKKRNGVNYR